MQALSAGSSQLSAPPHLHYNALRRGSLPPRTRAPTKLFPFNQAYWEGVELGSLTDRGAGQHFLLGQALRKRYVGSLLSPSYNRREVKAYCTRAWRTRYSAMFQLTGLFPEHMEERSKLWFRNPWKLSSIAEVVDKGGLRAYSIEAFEIALKYYSPKLNGQMKKFFRQSQQAQAFLEREEMWRRTLFPQVEKVLKMKVPSISVAADISSALDCDVHEGLPLPAGMPVWMHHALRQVHGFEKSSVPFAAEGATVVSHSKLFTHILDTFTQATDGTGSKFVLYSAHDTTVAGLLVAIGFSKETVPDFASAVFLELDKDLNVHCRLDDHKVSGSKIPFPCHLHDFAKALTPYCEFAKQSAEKPIIDSTVLITL